MVEQRSGNDSGELELGGGDLPVPGPSTVAEELEASGDLPPPSPEALAAGALVVDATHQAMRAAVEDHGLAGS